MITCLVTYFYFILQKIKKNKKQLAYNEEFKEFIENNSLNEIIEPAKINVTKEYHTVSEIFIINNGYY